MRHDVAAISVTAGKYRDEPQNALAGKERRVSARLKLRKREREAYTGSCIAPRNVPAGGKRQMGAFPPVVVFQSRGVE